MGKPRSGGRQAVNGTRDIGRSQRVEVEDDTWSATRAMANWSLEKGGALADTDRATPTWYVCPSVEEEFGIAILEAMEQGLPAADPLCGRVAHYVQDGVSGIVLDTSRAASLARGLLRLAAVQETDRKGFAEMDRDVVCNESVSAMAAALPGEYRMEASHRRTTSGRTKSSEVVQIAR
ncbi:glycosyltransferase [Streptomyces sp. NPDC088788]|uniref:glycosyltransferase n=1 Tax=Streptomyces sp. NPDC088788 TaxID=3365898 RepID=UPI00381132E6